MAEKKRVFSGVIYPDSTSYDCKSVMEEVKRRFKEWAFCAHDSDVDDDGKPKKLHIHWVARGDPRTLSAVANFLGLASHDVEIGRNFNSLVQYLIHLNDPDKFQYSPDAVSTNIPDIGKYLRKVSEGQLVKDLAGAKCKMSWYDLIQYAVENDSYDVLRRNLGIVKLVYEESTLKDDRMQIPERTLI